jgi:hypothetical protein
LKDLDLKDINFLLALIIIYISKKGRNVMFKTGNYGCIE